MASLRQNSSPQDLDSCKRKALLFLGVSVFPFHAFEAFASEVAQGSGLENQIAEQTGQGSVSSNPILSLLNVAGILGGGALAALYFTARKEKVESEGRIESLNSQLKEKNAAMVSLKNDLDSANTKITCLGRELQTEKNKIEGARAQIGALERDLEGARTDKQALEDELKEMNSLISTLQENIGLLKCEMKHKEEEVERLSSTLAQKDSELAKLDSIYKQTSEKLDTLSLEIAKLKDELLNNRHELEQKNLMVDGLNSQVKFLATERQNLTTNFNTLQQEYDDLKSSSEKNAASASEILAEREHELRQLQESYEVAVSDASAKEAKTLELTQERDDLKKKLDKEGKNVTILNKELKVAEAALESSRNEVSDLSKQLNESKKLCLELEGELLKLQTEFSHEKEALEKSLKEETLHSEKLAGELTSAKEALDKTKDKLQTVSNELATTSDWRDKLQKELAHEQKVVETLASHLENEKRIVGTLSKRLEASEEEEELRRSLEADLQVASKNIDDLTMDVRMLSDKLEKSGTQISDLEQKNDAFLNDLEKERKAAQQAQKSLEDAHSLVMKLGNQKEKLEKRAEKLEDDLASAKGEILRLTNEVNSSKTAVNGEPKKASEPEQGSESDTEPSPAVTTTASVTVRKSTRRRRANSQ